MAAALDSKPEARHDKQGEPTRERWNDDPAYQGGKRREAVAEHGDDDGFGDHLADWGSAVGPTNDKAV